MNNTKTIQGQSNVYDSSEAKGFKQSKNYPIAWEIIFLNDDTGKEFALNTEKSFSQLPKEQGYIVGLSDDANAPIRCLDCVFKNKDAFRKILNETLKGITIYDEIAEKVTPKTKMLQNAGKVLTAKMELAI